MQAGRLQNESWQGRGLGGGADDVNAPHVAWVMWGNEPLGGVRRALGNFAKALAESGWQVSIICLDEGELAVMLRDAGFHVHCLHSDGTQHDLYVHALQGRLGRLGALAQLRRYQDKLQAALASLGTDVVSIYWPTFLHLCGAPCRRLGIRLVWEMPEVPSVHRFRLNQRIYAAVLRYYRVMPIANSRFTAERLGPVSNLSVVYPPSDSQHFDPASVEGWTRKQWQLPEDSLLLGSVARLSPQKSCENLIRAFAHVQAEYPRLHLLFIGGPLDSNYAKVLQALVMQIGLSERIHFLGSVDDPAPAYRLLDLFISCRPDPEGFGLSIVEAMLMQVPVLARSLGGPAETVADGLTGWHFQDDSPQAIAAALHRAMAEREQWPQMGIAARQRAVAEFSLHASIPRYEQALRAQLGI